MVFPSSHPHLESYRKKQQSIAQELDGVSWFDVDAAMAPHTTENLLVDRNHLSRRGSEVLGAALADHIQAVLGWPEVP